MIVIPMKQLVKSKHNFARIRLHEFRAYILFNCRKCGYSVRIDRREWHRMTTEAGVDTINHYKFERCSRA